MTPEAMTNGTSLVENYERRSGELWGHAVAVTTYQLGEKWVCIVEDALTGAAICRTCAQEKELVLGIGLSKARDAIFSNTGPKKRSEQAKPENPRRVSYVECQVGDEQRKLAAEEFERLPVAEKQRIAIHPSTRFYDSDGLILSTGKALELLGNALLA